jgi:hypothetical protein
MLPLLGISEEIHRAVQSCTTYEPADRASAAETTAALERVRKAVVWLDEEPASFDVMNVVSAERLEDLNVQIRKAIRKVSEVDDSTADDVDDEVSVADNEDEERTTKQRRSTTRRRTTPKHTTARRKSSKKSASG